MRKRLSARPYALKRWYTGDWHIEVFDFIIYGFSFHRSRRKFNNK